MATYFGFDAYDVEKYSDPFVFISYKSEDSERVAVYARYLHDHGINVWYDNGLHAGSDWESYLMSVIEKPHCKAVLLFVSQKVAQSTVIPLETTQARACKKPTVAVYLEPGLDLEVLLNKAIKVYVAQRQSVDAFIGSEAEVCAQVLEAAKGVMSNISAVTSSSADTLWKNARMFMMNARRSRSEEDISKARGYLAQLTEQEPSDYRGWLGLAMCACLRRPETLDGAYRQLGEGAKYYSYVVASGADDIASAEYTEVKSRLWEDILDDFRQALGNCASIEDVEQLREKARQFDGRFRHTAPYVRQNYERMMGVMEERQEQLEKDAAKAATEKAVADQCGWKVISEKEVTLVKYFGEADNYVVPAVVDGRRVTSISERAFEGCINLSSVAILDNVTSIGDYTFSRCSRLASIAIPCSVTSIGEYAFEGCINLSSVTIPDSITLIENHAFAECSGLVSVTIPDGVAIIGAYAFCDCTSLSSVILSNSVKKIGKGTFQECTGLTSVTLPDSISSIDSSAFDNCTSLTSVNIPKGVAKIEPYTFRNCIALSSITIPDCVTSIGTSAFLACTSLPSVIIPDSVKSIDKYAFGSCTNLTSVTIPDGVTSIDDNAFKDCPNLTIYSNGGFSSYIRKYAKKNKIKYKKIKIKKVKTK